MAKDERKLDLIRYKVLRRFYEPLLLLGALDSIRGGRIRPEIISDNTGINHTQLRRSFADAIAYICAYTKGPDYVTAAALEKTPQGVVVWIAANCELGECVIDFLQRVLARVQSVVDRDDVQDRQRAAHLATKELSSMITTFVMPRLEAYCKSVINGLIQPCLGVLTDYSRENIAGDIDVLQIENLHKWLMTCFGDEHEDSRPSLIDIVNACYQIRHTQLLRTIRVFAGQGRTRAQEFERLYKLLGKLGRPIASSKILIDSAMTLSQDLIQGFTVKTVPSSKSRPIPIRPKEETTIKSIAGRIFSSQAEQDDFMERLSYLEGQEITELIQRERSQETRVHAELLLLDHFERNGCNFLDNHEKYIGCSKPACYLCHMYITQHPGHYVVPASHNKLYITWRPPDVFLGDNRGTLSSSAQERIMGSMVALVRKDLVTEIKSRTDRRPIHADSTTGITTTLDSVHIEGEDSPQDSYLYHELNELAEQRSIGDSDSDGGVQI